jgi:peroxidase
MCDTHMDVNCKGDLHFDFERSIYNANKSVRTNVNVRTAWIDGSQIYGSDKDTSNSLRSFKNGKLLTSAGNLLTFNNETGFISGDSRVNSNIALTGFHTIFVREHNRICDITLAKNPSLSD